MTARILDGRAVSAAIRSEVSERVRALSDKGVTPGLAAVLVGDDQASRIYVGAKHKACADVGIRSEQVDLPAYVTEGELLATLRRLNRDPDIHGILVQLPLPTGLRELEVQRTVAPEKDVDGLHPWNVGMMVRGEATFSPRPPTASSSSCCAKASSSRAQRSASWATATWWARRSRSCWRRTRSGGTRP